ncbi:transient-receptor-potential-like protein [Glandiceps talaboti]
MAIWDKELVCLDVVCKEYIRCLDDDIVSSITSREEEFFSAVEDSNYSLVKTIMSQDHNQVLVNYKRQRNGMSTSALEIAARKNDFYMVDLLLDGGAKLLQKTDLNDPATSIEEKINMYSAISSPAYITMSYIHMVGIGSDKCTDGMYEDFLQTAFELIKELEKNMNNENAIIWKEKYEAIQADLTTFTLEIMNCCNSTDEVKWLLGGGCYDDYDDVNEGGLCHGKCDTFASLLTLKRRPKCFVIVQKAIATNQKEFVTHHLVQRFLTEQWSRGQPEWTKRCGVGWTILHSLFCFFVFGIIHQLFPIHVFFCTKTRLHRLYECPKSSFLSHYFHYAFFLLFIFLYDVLVSYRVVNMEVSLVSNINHLPILALSIIWFLSLCLIEVAQCVTQGLRHYVKNYWNVLDMIILCSFFISVIIANPAIVGQIYGTPCIYILLNKLTSITFVCALLRFMEPFYLSRYIGPTLLVFNEMRHDIIRFLIIFFYVILACALAMYYFYVGIGEDYSHFTE